MYYSASHRQIGEIEQYAHARARLNDSQQQFLHIF